MDRPPPTPGTRAVPERIRVRQGQPTRVWIDGVRHRFGIAQVRRADAQVRVTVLSGRAKEGFVLRAGDIVDVAGHRWRVGTVDLGGETRPLVVLDRADDEQAA